VALVAVLITATLAASAFLLWYWFAPHTGRYGPILKQIEANQLGATGGRIDLSHDFPGVTPHDEAFITRRPDGSILVMFPTYYGKGISIGGLMYTSRPLRSDDTYVQELGTVLDRRVIDVGNWTRLSLDDRVNEHWYRVSRGVR
jgi:hypothetical protein